MAGLPVLASRISGSVGILGENYPGYFEVGDTRDLARLMLRAESEASFLEQLRSHCNQLLPLFNPICEEHAWAQLLREICRSG